MVTAVSILQRLSWIVGHYDENSIFGILVEADDYTVLRGIITTEGVWRISRKKGSPEILVTKLEEHGTGNILLPEFVQWRHQFVAQEIAQMLR